MYMCVKLPLINLNLDPYPPYPTNTYIYGVIIVLRVCGDIREKISKRTKKKKK